MSKLEVMHNTMAASIDVFARFQINHEEAEAGLSLKTPLGDVTDTIHVLCSLGVHVQEVGSSTDLQVAVKHQDMLQSAIRGRKEEGG